MSTEWDIGRHSRGHVPCPWVLPALGGTGAGAGAGAVTFVCSSHVLFDLVVWSVHLAPLYIMSQSVAAVVIETQFFRV